MQRDRPGRPIVRSPAAVTHAGPDTVHIVNAAPTRYSFRRRVGATPCVARGSRHRPCRRGAGRVPGRATDRLDAPFVARAETTAP